MQSKDNQINTIVAAVPVVALIELIINMVAMVTPAFLLISAGGRFLFLAGALVATLYLYSAVFLVLSGLILRFIPKPAMGAITRGLDKRCYAVYGAVMNMVHRNPLAGLLLKATPYPGNLFYTLAGARLDGVCMISEGALITDPFLTEIGSGSVIGNMSALIGHLTTVNHAISIGPIKIGCNVVVGVNSLIYPSVTIGDGSQLQAFSRVSPGTHIPAGEIWGGTPAKKIRDVIPSAPEKEISN